MDSFVILAVNDATSNKQDQYLFSLAWVCWEQDPAHTPTGIGQSILGSFVGVSFNWAYCAASCSQSRA